MGRAATTRRPTTRVAGQTIIDEACALKAAPPTANTTDPIGPTPTVIEIHADPARRAVDAIASSGGNRLLVSGIDAWGGTPIVDIKGYFPRDDMRPDARVPGWLEALWRLHDGERDHTARGLAHESEPANDAAIVDPGE